MKITDYDIKYQDESSLFGLYISEKEEFANQPLFNVSFNLYEYFSKMSKISVKIKNSFTEKLKDAERNKAGEGKGGK